MKKLIPLLVFLFVTSAMAAPKPTEEFPLWTKTPFAKGTEPHDIPTLTPFWPDAGKATGAAMVVCPGGGYGGLADHEGSHYARFLNEQGITAFVLKYRLGSKGYRHPVMLNDVSRAIRYVRAMSGDWALDANRIGVMGSSAGGHLTSTMVTHFGSKEIQLDRKDPIDKASDRPDLGILCYPVITFGEFTHKGSRRNLLGDEPSDEMIEHLSNEKQVKKNTPPCFVWHTWEDQAVPVENALLFAQGLRAQGVKFDLHIYEKGRHGIGLGTGREWAPDQRHPWTKDLTFWLKEQKFAR